MRMSLEYELFRNDYASFVLARSGFKVIQRWQWLLLFGLLLAVGILTALLRMMYGDFGWLDLFPVFRALAIGIVTVLGLLFILLGIHEALRLLLGRIQTPGSALGRHRIDVSNEGYIDKGPRGDFSHSWSEVTELRNGPEAIGIVLGRSDLCVVPKRAFPNEQSCRDFMAQVDRCIAEARKGPIGEG